MLLVIHDKNRHWIPIKSCVCGRVSCYMSARRVRNVVVVHVFQFQVRSRLATYTCARVYACTCRTRAGALITPTERKVCDRPARHDRCV